MNLLHKKSILFFKLRALAAGHLSVITLISIASPSNVYRWYTGKRIYQFPKLHSQRATWKTSYAHFRQSILIQIDRP